MSDTENASPPKILFVCTHNATRSPMAAALAGSMCGAARVQARSAGVYPGDAVDPLAVAAMAEIGLDIADHEAHSVTDLEAAGDDIGAYAAVIALTDAAEEALSALLRGAAIGCERWEVDEPAAERGDHDARLGPYRAARDALQARIRERFGDGASRLAR